MRKPRDFDYALKSLTDKAKALQQAKRRQLGELVIATGADALDIETLAGALIVAAQSTDTVQKLAWKKAGEEFFRKAKAAESGDAGHRESTQQDNSLASPARSAPGKI